MHPRKSSSRRSCTSDNDHRVVTLSPAVESTPQSGAASTSSRKDKPFQMGAPKCLGHCPRSNQSQCPIRCFNHIPTPLYCSPILRCCSSPASLFSLISLPTNPSERANSCAPMVGLHRLPHPHRRGWQTDPNLAQMHVRWQLRFFAAAGVRCGGTDGV